MESELVTQSGSPLHSEDEFIEDLATHIMDRYEGQQPDSRPLEIRRLRKGATRRTRKHYRRLFENSGEPTWEFVSWSAEVLANLIEELLEGATSVFLGKPHNADPAFDVLSVIETDSGEFKLRVVQVKATPDNLQGNCSEALRKFERLREGDYDAELAATLELMERCRELPSSVQWEDLFYDPGRRYRITAVHEEDRNAFKILTRFELAIPGDSALRSVRLVRVSWTDFWNHLGQRVYAQLT